MDIGPLIGLLLAHKFVAAGAAACVLLVTLLSDRVRFLPTWTHPLRPILGTLAGVLGVVLDQVSNGVDAGRAAIAALSTAMPVLIAEIVALVTKGGGGAGPDASVNDGAKPRSSPPGPFVKMAATVLACASLATGCASLGGLAPVLQDAILVVEDGQAILTALRAAYDFLSLTTLLTDDQKRVASQAFQDASLALDAAVRALHGGKDLTESHVDAAFEDFRNAYSRLVSLLKELGAVKEAATGALMARRGQNDVVIIPLAFQIKVSK